MAARRSRGPRKDPTRAIPPVAPARAVAHRVLSRVAGDDAWAERALHAAFQRTHLSPADRALATQLVYGTLRQQRWLDFLLGSLATQPLKKIPLPVIAALRMGAYELTQTRTPSYAAVNDAVNLVAARQSRLRGFANAILRQLARLQERDELPQPELRYDDPLEVLAVRTSQPTWLIRLVAEHLGPEEARAWAEANNRSPPVVLRVNPLRTTQQDLLAKLEAAGVAAQAVEGVPNAIELTRPGAIPSLPGFAEGLFSVQDPAAQLVGRLAPAAAGEVVLDACAAPGGKAIHLAQQMEDRGRVLALDVHAGKTRLVHDNAARLGLQSIETLVGDAASADTLRDILEERGLEHVDGVVLDAPCLGTGTLARNPELRTRDASDLNRLAHQQGALLESAVTVLKPGGWLVYAVCSITPQEGEQQVERVLSAHPELRVEPIEDPVLQPFMETSPVGPVLRTWPHRHRMDGFFAARLRKA